MCEHNNFNTHVMINHVLNEKEENIGFQLQVSAVCSDCDQPFEFPGIPEGQSSIEARTTPNRMTLIVPLKPADQPHFNYWSYSKQELPV